MKHGKRRLHLDRTTIKPLTPEQLVRVGGGTDGGTDADGDSEKFCTGSMTGNYSVDPCPYSGDCR